MPQAAAERFVSTFPFLFSPVNDKYFVCKYPQIRCSLLASQAPGNSTGTVDAALFATT